MHSFRKGVFAVWLGFSGSILYATTSDLDDVIELNMVEIPTPESFLRKIEHTTTLPDGRQLDSRSGHFSMQDGDIDPLPLPEDASNSDNGSPQPTKPDNDPVPADPPPPQIDNPFPDPVGPNDPLFPWVPDDPWAPDFPIPGGEQNPIVIVDQIVNLGHKVWKIVEANQPVLDIQYKYANAIPKGIAVTDLEYFSPIQHRSFRLIGTNGFGTQVFDVTYTLVHRFGGKYKDTGAFLERVSVVPHTIEALWGYTINFNVLNVTVANVGSKENPIASMGIDAQLDIGTIIKKSSRRLMFEFRGDSPSVRRIAAAK